MSNLVMMKGNKGMTGEVEENQLREEK